MRKIISIIAALIFSVSIYAKSESALLNPSFIDGNTDTIQIVFKVNGNAACKSNIESVLTQISGVVLANWDASSKMITVKYVSTQVQVSDFYALLANAGYDNAELRAKTIKYDALDQACKYTRDSEAE